ncbi:MAG: hypothetical protein DI539_23015 [Flavobacterium psychrophilum]|nr:MAG: hypothetical protein DI539_23015 [Flavobacterium psychrophilum]
MNSILFNGLYTRLRTGMCIPWFDLFSIHRLLSDIQIKRAIPLWQVLECVVQRQITLRDRGGTSAEQLSDLFCPFYCADITQKSLWDRGQ